MAFNISLQINKLNAETIEAIEDVENNRNLSRTFDLDYSWKYHKAHDIRLYAIF